MQSFNGDAILNEEQWNATYIFHERDEKKATFCLVADLSKDADLVKQVEQENKLKRDGIIIHYLFPPPNGDDSQMKIYYELPKIAHAFFKEVFGFPNVMQFMWQNFYPSRIIINKKKFDDIHAFILKNSLEKYEGLIFFIIAEIQRKYIEQIEPYERSKTAAKDRLAGKEFERLITVIERGDKVVTEKADKRRKSESSGVSFDYPDGPSVKLKEVRVIRHITKAIKEYFNRGEYKHWKKELTKTKAYLIRESEKIKFKFYVAIALHNFFSALTLFPVKEGNATSDLEMLCIAQILEYGLITIGKEAITDRQKINAIRNYIKPDRNQLFTYHIFSEKAPKLDLLKKYFDLDFLTSVSLKKDVLLLKEADYVCERLDTRNWLPELSHIIACIRLRVQQLDWRNTTLTDESRTFLTPLLKLISSDTLITNFSFNVNREQERTCITEEFLSVLLKKMINEYKQNHPEELYIDVLATTIEQDTSTGFYKVEMLPIFQDLRKRFFPTISANLFRFLMTEVFPQMPAENAFEKCSSMIAVILQHCYVFREELNREVVVQKKVKNWLKEAGVN